MKYEEQLKTEIQHIFDSGANEIRIFEMVKAFIEKRFVPIESLMPVDGIEKRMIEILEADNNISSSEIFKVLTAIKNASSQPSQSIEAKFAESTNPRTGKTMIVNKKNATISEKADIEAIAEDMLNILKNHQSNKYRSVGEGCNYETYILPTGYDSIVAALCEMYLKAKQ